VKNGTLGTIEQVSAQSMTGADQRWPIRSLSTSRNYNNASTTAECPPTIPKAQSGMTVDRAPVCLADALHGRSMEPLSLPWSLRHRDGVDLH